MKTFILKVLIFTCLLISVLLVTIFFVPNLVIKDSLYYAILDKHKLLEDNSKPRMIFLGGSNLSFGLNSKVIEDSLNYNVINMGIQAGIGLKYICDDILPYIGKNDVVIVSPEYAHLIKNDENTFLGTDKLLYIIFDIYPEGRKHIHGLKHWWHLSKLMPKYAADKLYFLPKGLISKYGKNTINDDNQVYSRASFNEDGDVTVHWNMPNTAIDQYIYKGKVNREAIHYLNQYKELVESKGAAIYYVASSYQETAYNKNKTIIDAVDTELSKSLKIKQLDNYRRFIFNDSLFFNTVYHLNKQGADLRTMYLIEDLKRQASENNRMKVMAIK